MLSPHPRLREVEAIPPPPTTGASRWLALIAADILPGTGRDPVVRLDKTPDADGAYPLILPGPDGGEVVGRFQLFDEAGVSAIHGLHRQAGRTGDASLLL